MKTDDCFYLGKIGKPFGYKGEMNVFLDVDKPSEYSSLKSVFILTSQGLVPYMITSVAVSPARTTIIFAGLTSSEAALLQGKELYLPMTMLPPLTGNKFYFHEVKNFSVIDENYGYIGILKEIIDNGPQPVICISAPSAKEVLVPLIDEFIISVNRISKTLTIKSPEGLIEFYLEKV
ncbi:MAG: ribosome maturation factor RimM [Bacteroidales bacterium]|jgi:16S rRNA processing protein RimM|nr:ribosome maturation factor RimM [Bacteroidales bacterium]